MNRLSRLMEEAVEARVFPGGALAVGTPERVVFSRGFGRLSQGSRRRVDENTLFDLASLTKPLATAVTAMVLVGEGTLSLSETLGERISEFSGTGYEGATVAQLLSHCAGFPAWRPLFRTLAGVPKKEKRRELRRLLATLPREYEPGTASLYSDLDYLALLSVLERAGGSRLDVLAQKRVYEPLGVEDLFFLPLGGDSRALPGRAVAATENCPWRKKLLAGEVHDDNAHAMGGVAAHAGLFGTALSVYAMLAALWKASLGKTGETPWDSRVVRAFFSTRPGPGDFVLGFETPTRPDSSSGKGFSDDAVGHLGYTGTSFWMDLQTGFIVVLLTNRVNFGRENIAIRAFRPVLHDAAVEVLRRTASTEGKGNG